jgi:hypothetical protein
MDPDMQRRVSEQIRAQAALTTLLWKIKWAIRLRRTNDTARAVLTRTRDACYNLFRLAQRKPQPPVRRGPQQEK